MVLKRVEGESIMYLARKEMYKRLRRFGYSRLKSYLTGGYCFPATKRIYIRNDRKNDIKLLAHERGHLLGFTHTVYPTIMFFSWVGRWFNTYYPYYPYYLYREDK